MIKSWQMFLESLSYEDEVAAICEKYKIVNWSINKDGLVDVYGDVDLSGNNLNKLPIKFGKVFFDFDCSDNSLITLEGCPIKVGCKFACNNNNNLISLEGCPQAVGDIFYCTCNELISLEGLGYAKDFYANNNPVSNLSIIGQTMIKHKISFLEAVMFNIRNLDHIEIDMIMNSVDPQKILDLNNFKLLNLLRTQFPKKYAEVCSLRDVSVQADLGELGF